MFQFIIYSLFCLVMCRFSSSFQFHSNYINTLKSRQNISIKMSTSESESFKSKKPSIRSKEWAEERGMEPGYGGIWPGDPNAPTYKVTIRTKSDPSRGYTLDVPIDRYVYYVFEEAGIELPIINQARMCRQGCCTTCAAKLIEGKVKMDSPLGLLKNLKQEGYVLTCCSLPESDLICELQDEDEVYIKQWGESFESGGVEWGGVFPDEDG